MQLIMTSSVQVTSHDKLQVVGRQRYDVVSYCLCHAEWKLLLSNWSHLVWTCVTVTLEVIDFHWHLMLTFDPQSNCRIFWIKLLVTWKLLVRLWCSFTCGNGALVGSVIVHIHCRHTITNVLINDWQVEWATVHRTWVSRSLRGHCGPRQSSYTTTFSSCVLCTSTSPSSSHTTNIIVSSSSRPWRHLWCHMTSLWPTHNINPFALFIHTYVLFVFAFLSYQCFIHLSLSLSVISFSLPVCVSVGFDVCFTCCVCAFVCLLWMQLPEVKLKLNSIQNGWVHKIVRCTECYLVSTKVIVVYWAPAMASAMQWVSLYQFI